ncbi:MAG: hypothetical protein HeimC3_17010 [Candidatus Heimdallarchaeota archaeon LC_3]|nr:MAG: hypothetical protein HeimC3_17010 [Candidatus Heimdallarchaeota archaeon LC_3]
MLSTLELEMGNSSEDLIKIYELSTYHKTNEFIEYFIFETLNLSQFKHAKRYLDKWMV